MSEIMHLSDIESIAALTPPPEPPPYTPPAIELRMPLETTAAFCDTAVNGKEYPLCTGPINS